MSYPGCLASPHSGSHKVGIPGVASQLRGERLEKIIWPVQAPFLQRKSRRQDETRTRTVSAPPLHYRGQREGRKGEVKARKTERRGKTEGGGERETGRKEKGERNGKERKKEGGRKKRRDDERQTN